MNFARELLKNPSRLLQGTASLLCLVFLIWYFWKRRWLYYYSMKLKGPLSLPFIGSLSIVFAGQKGVLQEYIQMMNKYPRIWKMWIGSDLYITSTRAKDIEQILPSYPQKEGILLYDYVEGLFSSILTTRIDRWKTNRKILNPALNQKILDSYFDSIVKHVKNLTTDLDDYLDEEFDALPVIWTKAMDASSETLGGVDPETLPFKTRDLFSVMMRVEESFVERLVNILYYFEFLWNISRAKKDLYFQIDIARKQIGEFVKRHETKRKSSPGDRKSFLNFMEKLNYTPSQAIEELIILFVASTQTTTLTICTGLLLLAMNPEIQEKLYKEIVLTCGKTDTITPANLNSLTYLDRLIKEVLRLTSSVPLVGRNIDKTSTIDSQVYPESCKVIFPIVSIHRDPEYWPDPLKFDPDRFLLEEMMKRPRGAYIPFADGPRGCIGQAYGRMMVKLFIAEIVRNFQVTQNRYKDFSEIEMVFQVVAKNGYKVMLTKRET